MLKSMVLIIISIFLFIGQTDFSFSQTTGEKKEKEALTIVGTLKCSSCDLKKEHGAGSQCSIYGCQYSFKTEKVTNAQGKRMKKYERKTYSVLLNDASKDLVQKEHKKRKFTITGVVYDEENVVEVVSFEEVKQ